MVLCRSRKFADMSPLSSYVQFEAVSARRPPAHCRGIVTVAKARRFGAPIRRLPAAGCRLPAPFILPADAIRLAAHAGEPVDQAAAAAGRGLCTVVRRGIGSPALGATPEPQSISTGCV